MCIVKHDFTIFSTIVFKLYSAFHFVSAFFLDHISRSPNSICVKLPPKWRFPPSQSYQIALSHDAIPEITPRYREIWAECHPTLSNTKWVWWQKINQVQEKKEEIWLSPMTKAPTPTEKSKKQRDNTKTPPKTSITQRLRTDLGRLVEVTITTQLVWLNRFTRSQHSH